MIITDFGRALSQLFDPRFRRVLGLGLGLTVALFVAIFAGLLALINGLTADTTTIPFFGEVTWVGDFLSWGSIVIMLFASIFLMIPVASAITSFFLGDVARAVEEEYYPHLPPAPGSSFGDDLKDTVNFMGVLVAVNVVAIILCVIFSPLAPFILYGTNGYLLGREYFTLVARRRHSDAEARALRRVHSGQIWIAGILMAIPLTIPIINLFIPVLGAATFTHLYHRVAAQTA